MADSFSLNMFQIHELMTCSDMRSNVQEIIMPFAMSAKSSQEQLSEAALQRRLATLLKSHFSMSVLP